MWLCQCVENSNLNVTLILDLNQPDTTLSTNVETMFTLYCLNIVSVSVPNIRHQHSLSVKTAMFTQHCLNVVWILVNVNQCCDNIVAMLGFWLKYNVGTTFTQRCLNAHTRLLGRLKVSTSERYHKVGADVETTVAPTLWQPCHNVEVLAGRVLWKQVDTWSTKHTLSILSDSYYIAHANIYSRACWSYRVFISP